MSRRLTSLSIVAATLATLSWCVVPCTAQAKVIPAGSGERKTVWDGVFDGSQAAAGEGIYAKNCATCHGPVLSGGSNQGAPPLKGDKFMENWREDQLDSLYWKIIKTMPRRSDTVLTELETLEVMSYILRENSFPAGSSALDPSVLSTILIQRKEGPKPLPSNSLVQVIGCMVQDGTAWTLGTASPPLRVRSSEKATPEELQAAQMKPLGTLTFRLQNLIMLGAFKPGEHVGQKMIAKGSLTRRSDGDNISVTELEMLSPNCGQ